LSGGFGLHAEPEPVDHCRTPHQRGWTKLALQRLRLDLGLTRNDSSVHPTGSHHGGQLQKPFVPGSHGLPVENVTGRKRKRL